MAPVDGARLSIYSVRVGLDLTLIRLWLTVSRYVENTLENSHNFDAKGLVSQDPSYEGRLKYWTQELCAKHPHTFDFVITVALTTPTPERLR